jgi:hypothetical protein
LWRQWEHSNLNRWNKATKFDGFISWTLLYCQFEMVAEHNCTAREKATHLLATMQVQVSDISIDSVGFCAALDSLLLSHNAAFLFSMV